MDGNEVVVKKKSPIVIFVIIAVLLVAGIVIAILFISGNSKGKRLQKQLELGQKYLTDLDYENAILAYKAAIEIDPKCEDAYLGIAKVEEKLLAEIEAGENTEELRGLLEETSSILGEVPKQIDSSALRKKIDKNSERKTRLETKKANDTPWDSENEGETADYSEAYKAYYDYLSGLDLKTELANSYGTDKKVIAFSDVYGDNQPEMIFLNIYTGSDSVQRFALTGVTYRNGRIETVLPQMDCDYPAQAYDTYMLFHKKGSKTLYGLEQSGCFRDFEMTNVIRFRENGNQLENEYLYREDDEVISCDEYDDMNDIWTYSYMKGDTALSEEDFRNEIREFLKDTEDIVYFGLVFWDKNNYGIDAYKDKDISMSYDDAIAYLRSQMNQ